MTTTIGIRTTRRGGPHESLTGVDAPPIAAIAIAAAAEIELGRDVCVHPVPFTRYGGAGVGCVRVDGRLELEGEVRLEGPGYG